MSSHVEQIKSRLGIAEVVESYLKLQRAGVNFKAPCPFHNEKTPSFFVSPSRESWHCFGCNRGGDIFSFVMEIEGVDFPGALRVLARRAGVELTPVDLKQKSERVSLLRLLDEAKKFYEVRLKENAAVINYLKERGMKGETAKAFGVGFAPDGWRNLYDFLKKKGFSGEEMEKAGLVIKKSSADSYQSSAYYDRFRSRIMFPLNNSSGQIVGFSGRIFKSAESQELKADSGNEVAKYINTPQTLLYDKSKVLYGFDKAKTEIRKKGYCILVEGQMDVIMSHQAGFVNTAAVSGTALTSDHLKMIKRLCDSLVMAFDKDDAGFQASKRGIDIALAEGLEVKVAEIPSGKDPADTVKEDPEVWRKAVDGAKHIIDFYLDILNDRKEIEKIVLPYIAALSSDIEKAEWVKKTAKKLSIGEEPIWEELKKIKLTAPKRDPSEKPNIQNNVGKMTHFSLVRDRLLGFLVWKKDTNDQSLKEKISEISEKFNLIPEDDREDLVFEAESFYNEAKDLKKELIDLALDFEREDIKRRLEEITEEVRKLERSDAEDDKIKKQLDKFYKLTKELNELKQNDKTKNDKREKREEVSGKETEDQERIQDPGEAETKSRSESQEQAEDPSQTQGESQD